jgi:hypothetical protein
MTPNGNHRVRLLVGKKTIMEYLGIGAPLFAELVKEGMPVRIYGNKYIASSVNLDTFFERFTAVRSKYVDEIE